MVSRPNIDRAEILRRSRELRSTRRKHRFYVLLALPVVLVITLVALAHWDRLLISEVAVQGAQTIATERVQATALEVLVGRYAGLFPRRNILLWPRQAIQDRLARDYPAFRQIDLERSKQKLLIIVQERVAEYLWCGAEESSPCLFLDRDGFAFDHAPEFSGHPFFEIIDHSALPVLGRSPLPPGEFSSTVLLSRSLSSVLSDSVIASVPTMVDLKETGELHFQVGRTVVLVMQSSDPIILERDLRAAINSESFLDEYRKSVAAGHQLEYLDLRSAGKMFYKFGP